MKTAATLLLLLGALGCGADPTPAPADSGAQGDASSDARPNSDFCTMLGRLDCDGDPSRCETPHSNSNCGACGRACPAGAICSGPEGICLQ